MSLGRTTGADSARERNLRPQLSVDRPEVGAPLCRARLSGSNCARWSLLDPCAECGSDRARFGDFWRHPSPDGSKRPGRSSLVASRRRARSGSGRSDSRWSNLIALLCLQISPKLPRRANLRCCAEQRHSRGDEREARGPDRLRMNDLEEPVEDRLDDEDGCERHHQRPARLDRDDTLKDEDSADRDPDRITGAWSS